MVGSMSPKRKTMKPRKRLGRLHAERIYNLLKGLKKVGKSKVSLQTNRRLDFGDKSPQNSRVLPKPTFYTPKGKDALVADFLKKFQGLADEVVSDDEDLSVKFATMKISKPSTDYDFMLLECPNTDENFLAAVQRSAKKLAIASLDEAEAEPIEPKSEIDISKPLEELKTVSNPPLKKPEECLKIETVPKPHEARPEEKTDKVSSANLEIIPKQSEKTQPNPPAEMGSNILNNKLKIISKSTEKKPENSSKTEVPKAKPLAKLESVPKPSQMAEKIGDKIPKSKPSGNPETVPKVAVTSSKVVVPKANPSSNITKPVPKRAQKKNKKGNRKPLLTFEEAPKYSYQTYMNTFSNIAAPNRIQTNSMINFRFLRNPYKRFVVIDGSNVAFAHANQRWFSSEGIAYCLQYFERMGHPAKAVLPLFRRNAFQSSHPQLLDHLHREGKIIFTPCKNLSGIRTSSYDDRFILQLAYEMNAAVVSNDNYNDICNESLEFRQIVENRVVGYCWCGNLLMLPQDPYGQWGPSLGHILQC